MFIIITVERIERAIKTPHNIVARAA